MACWCSRCAFVDRVPIWCIAITAVSFFSSLFRSWSVFPASFILWIGCSSIFFLGLILVLPVHFLVFFLFFLSYVFFSISLTTFGTSKSFPVNSLSLSFLSVNDDMNFGESFLFLNFGFRKIAFFFHYRFFPVIFRCFGVCLFRPGEVSSWLKFVSCRKKLSVI